MTDAVRTLTAVRALQAARRTRRPGSPAELARMLDPKFNVTPTIRILSDIAVRSFRNPDQRDAVSTPPRTGKTQTVVVWNIVWLLMMNPDLLIIVTAYGDSLAEEHSRKARAIINEHAEVLGYSVSPDKTAVKRWTVEGRRGGVLAAGIQSGITGMGADVLLIDDPLKDQADADSATIRKKILGEYQSTLAPRVHPGGSVTVIQTRWHESDLIGSLIKQEPDVWVHTNIPAVAESGVPDALGRAPGATMISALGYTAKHYAAMRRTSGERTWYALYQGVPANPEGGLVKREWLNAWRMAAAPAAATLTVVGVDPSDSGKGDACGIVAASLTSDGVVAMIADKSAPMTSEQWARAAVDLAVEVGASEIAVEGFAARETYVRVVNEAIGRSKVRYPIKVTSWPPKGSGRGGGDAVARSSALIQALEVGTCRLAGFFPEFEASAVLWQAGQHQPDRLAALVVGHDVLVHSGGQEWQLAGPVSDQVGGQQSADVTSIDWMRQRVS